MSQKFRYGLCVSAFLMSFLGSEHAGATIYAATETPLTLTTTSISKLDLSWVAEKASFFPATLTTRLKLGELRIDVEVGGMPISGKNVAVKLTAEYQNGGPGRGYMLTKDEEAPVQRLSVTLAEGSEGSQLACDAALGLCPLSGEAQERYSVSLWADSGQSAVEGAYQAMIDVEIYT
ncbi:MULTISPECIES: hypothetical protein [Serratia]|uniref:hypothetical protein n=1 Tax=Serratia TaxID=613 RepID=UPI002179B8B4|nr:MULTISPECIES: hypothetical protein [Serratia]CAI1000939.1 Uncharacterised protein [Serratia quinivorans]CAI1086440.1 Uncharacterised protein [Serratia quinivorans]CAI2122320.1 Uncharacterised protein [Serratia quinivorans]